MSILKNFVNPWGKDGALFNEDIISTAVLENNVLSDNSNSSPLTINGQEKQFNGYIFDDTASLHSVLGSIGKEIKNIFKKNKIDINIIIISEPKKLQFLKDYDTVVGIAMSPGGTIGVSEPIINNNEYIADEFKVYFEDGTVATYVNKISIAHGGSSDGGVDIYKAAYFMAHELLHQALIKAFAQLYGENLWEINPAFQISHREVKLITAKFNIHENERPNLNMRGDLVSVPSQSSTKLSPQETILPKHISLLHHWLNPRIYEKYKKTKAINPYFPFEIGKERKKFFWQYKEIYLKK
jgi:hypothetical protein